MQATRTALRESLASEYLRLLLAGMGAVYAAFWCVVLSAGPWGNATTEMPHWPEAQTALGLAVAGLVVLAIAVAPILPANRLAMWAATIVAAGFLLLLLSHQEVRSNWDGHFLPFSPGASIVYMTAALLLACLRLSAAAEPAPSEACRISRGQSEQLSLDRPLKVEASEQPDVVSVDQHADTSEEAITVKQPAAGIAKLLILGCGAALLLYMIAWPMVQLVLGWGEFKLPSTMGDKLSLGQEIRIRTAKLSVFLIFVAIGASFGSFLHVIADTIPRGQGIPLRSSACPGCKSRIRRIDNIPIVSYLILRGRCRDCGTGIPMRYLWAELSMAGLFAGFFLFELVTGAANLPGFRTVHYTGIVWIILYTKWDIVGIVGFHLLLYAAILTTLFANWQKHRMPWYFWGVMFVTAFSLPLAFHYLLPLKLFAVKGLSPVLMNALTSVVGGLVAVFCGAFLTKIFGELSQLHSSEDLDNDSDFRLGLDEVTPALTLLGIGLGWQAVLGIAAVLGIMNCCLLVHQSTRIWFATHGLLAMVFAAAIVHQFSWQFLVKLGQPIWLHQYSSLPMILAFAFVVFIGLFGAARGWKSYLLKVD